MLLFKSHVIIQKTLQFYIKTRGLLLDAVTIWTVKMSLVTFTNKKNLSKPILKMIS